MSDGTAAFVVRDPRDIQRLLSRAYRTEVDPGPLLGGLATVAAALNCNDLLLAHIAAVHLRIPDLPDRAARERLEAEDRLIKYARDRLVAKSGDWSPALHPRAGTPPNPGWFAPTDAGSSEGSATTRVADNSSPQQSDASPEPPDDRVKLRPGPQRVDELADLIEWMANSKPEDEAAIRAEIKKRFFDVGDQGSANALNSALTVLLRPDLTKEQRQKLLDGLDIYTRVDPADYVPVSDAVTGAAVLAGGLPSGAAGEAAAGEAAATAATADATSNP